MKKRWEKLIPAISLWSGEFGRAYTDRNLLSVAELDEMYLRRFGVTRTAMNVQFLGGLDRATRILEVGSNAGVQLQCLQAMGFTALYGVEIQRYAVELARIHSKGIRIIQASAFDLPFQDRSFDLVFTSGVMIHIAPTDLEPALREIYRCTRRYIWAMEYFAPTQVEVPYRGIRDALWKADYARVYLEMFHDLRLRQHRLYRYVDSSNEDAMFLLETRTQDDPAARRPLGAGIERIVSISQ